MVNFVFIGGVQVTNNGKRLENWEEHIEAPSFEAAVLTIARKYVASNSPDDDPIFDIYLRKQGGGFKYFQAKVVSGKLIEIVDCTLPKCLYPHNQVHL